MANTAIPIPRHSDATADQQGMDLLAAHVPLTLLMDLAEDEGPESSYILVAEAPSEDDLAWLSVTD